ncbi:DEAD/DEAH box helicase family protein [Campylobacter sp. 9BO]|uniref:putative barnase/colicin E5 family endoribonuclease n=2 Tax=Campylobacter TaxID=194 RepID=UPI003D34DEB6
MHIDINNLRQDNYSDDEIIGILKQNNSLNMDFAKARELGASSTDIVNLYSQKLDLIKQKQNAKPQEQNQEPIIPIQNMNTNVKEPTTQEPNTQSKAYDTLGTNEQEPLIDEQTQKILQNNSIKAPQAPIMPDEINTQKSAWDKASEAILDGISEVGKAAKDIASPLIQAVDGYKQIFNMGEYANTHKARQEELTKKLATKEYLQNGTFALNPFLKSKEESQSDKEALINFFNDEAIKLGFKPKIKTESNGEVKFGIELADGKVRDITPGFMDAIMPSKNEIVGSIGGTLASAAVLGLTKNPALAGEASAYMRALAHPTTKIFAGGAVGSGVGALQDYRQNTALVGEEATLKGASSAMLGGVANEALGVGMAEAVAKAIPQVNKLMSVLPKYSDKAINFMPVLKQLRTQNISGAMRELEKQVGGKAELEAILAKANEAGVVVDISDASYVAKMTKDKLGDAEKFIDKLDETTQNQTLKKGLSFAKKLDEVAIKGVSYIEHGFLSKEAITDAQSKILTIARANSRVGEMLGSILSQNATAANNLKQMINTDTDKIFKELESISGDRASIKQVAKEYVDGVKAEFDEMLDVLSTRYEGIKTTLPDTPNAQQFLDDIQVLKDSSWKVLSNRNLKAILNNLENSKEIQIADVNTLRTELNKIIANSDDFSTKDIARSAKAYVENDVLDDILGRLELGDEAKKLYKEAVAQYKDMKVVENSLWYKNRVAGARAGDYSDTKVAELALKEFNKAVNKDGSNLGSVAYLLNKISPEKAASIELEFIEQILTQNTFKGEGVKAINLSEAIKAMGKIGFRSEEAKGFNALLKNLEPIINQDIHLASSTQIFKQQEKFGTGIGYHLDTKAKVWISNRTIKNIIRLLPILGDQPSLIHHLNQAALKAKDYKGFINEVKIIGSSPTTPSGIKTAINEYIRAADDLQKQYDSVVGNAEKQTEQMPSKNDALEKAEPSSEDALHSHSDTMPDGALKLGQDDRLDGYNNSIASQKFTVGKSGEAYQYANQNFEPQKWINDLSGVLNDEWIANLKSLAVKHPEMFKSEADVFRVIKQIKDNPTHFFKNNNERNAIVGSELKNGKFGEVAVNKENGKVVHATQIQKDRRIKQLNTRQEKELGSTVLVSDRSARLNRHSDTSQTMATAKAGSAANNKSGKLLTGTPHPATTTSNANVAGGLLQKSTSDEIIPQQTSKSEASLQNKGKNITKISQNELTADMLKQIEKNNQRVAVGENLNPDQAVKLGFKYPNDVRRTIGADEIRHTLNRHGENSSLVKSSGQKAVTLEDIAKWQEFSDTADMKALSKDNMGQSVLISGKQINGHYVVVESVRTKGNELAFKTMYFEKGELKDSKAFKEAQTLLYGYEPNANSFASLKTDEIIPQQTSKSENLTQNNQNFTIQGNQATKSDLNVNVSVDDWVKELSQINSNELTANLFILQQKHPELFKKPSDVYKMLVQIKNNPTHFFKNNRPDMALIAKILQDGSVGKMAIVKDSGKVSHITKSTKDRELKRLQNVNERELGAGSPYPTQQSSKTLPANGDGAKAHSLATDEIIPQQTSKSEVFKDEKFAKDYEIANSKPTLALKEQYLKKLRDEIEARYNITPIKEFGTNYAEFYHDGVGAVNKLLAEKNGQVTGAFYKEDLGDIDLVWGKVLKDEKGQIQGYGLAKIKEKHPEITPEILDDVIKTGEIKTRQNEAVQIIKDNYKIILKSNWMGEPTKNKWVLSAYENGKGKSSSISSDDFTKADNLAKTPNDEIIPQQELKSEVFKDEKFAKDYEIANSKPTLALKEQYLKKLRDEIEARYNITPIKEFGTNYAEFYHDGVGAVNKLLAEKNGQVAGAFYKEGLGDIDLVWGDDKIGLNKILSKHADDFKEFGGVGKGLDEIVNNGEVVSKNGVETIILNKNDKIFKIGLSKGWNDEGKNDWIITAYEFKKEGNGKTPDDAIFTAKQPLANPSEDIIPKNEIKSEMPLENGLKDDINEWVITAYKKEKEPSRSVVRPSSDLGQNGTDLSANGLNEIIPQQTSKSEVFKDEKFAKAYEVANAKPTEFLKEQYLKKLRDEIEARYNITPIKEFGTNYAEFYHDGVGAVNKLLAEKNGQVTGAFWRDEIGDITLHWGDVGSGKSDGSGLAKIVKFHPEVLNNLDELVQTLPIKKETQRRYQLENENYKVGIRKDFNGDNQNWVLTAFEKKDSIARRTTDLSSSQSDKGKTAPLDTDEIIPQQELKSEMPLENGLKDDIIDPQPIKQGVDDGTSRERSGEIYSGVDRAGSQRHETIRQTGTERLDNQISKTSDRDLREQRREYGSDQGVHSGGRQHSSSTTSGVKSSQDMRDDAIAYDGSRDSTRRLSDQGGDEIIHARSTSTDNALRIEQGLQKQATQIKGTLSHSGAKTPDESALIQNYHAKNIREYGGEITRYNENIAAIKLLKELEATARAATQDEQEILAHYNGWGGLSNAFNETNAKWADKFKELSTLLEPSEMAAARASVLNSFYTPHEVVDSIWQVLKKQGFKGGEILEPSMGIGNFFSLMPREIMANSNLSGVELDSITARIAKQLHPNAKILNDGFQKFNTNKKYDLVITNPPFGALKISDVNNKELNGLNIHSYFVLKSLEQTKDNGLNVFVVTSNLMDARDNKLKQMLAKKAEFLGGVRLPNSTFKDTQVTTDILFLRKKTAQEIANGEIDEKIAAPLQEVLIHDKDGNAKQTFIHSYFANDNKIGEYFLDGGMYGGNTLTLRNTQDQNIASQIINKLERIKLPINEMKANIKDMTPYPQISDEAMRNIHKKEHLRSGSIFEYEGKIYRKVLGDEPDEIKGYELLNLDKELHEYTKSYQETLAKRLEKTQKMVKDYNDLSDTLFSIKAAEMNSESSDEMLKGLRDTLKQQYYKFKKQYGFITNSSIAKIFEGDPTYAHLSALEKNYRRERVNGKLVEKAELADIFNKRIMQPYIEPSRANSIDEAIAFSLNKYGKFNMQYTANLLNKNIDKIEREMLDGNFIFKDQSGLLVPKDEFLSGNVKEKLAKFKNIGELDSDMLKSMQELQKIIPADVEISDIGINLGAAWIPKQTYEAFGREILGGSGDVFYHPSLGWKVNFKSGAGADTSFGVIGKYKQATASDIYEAALNNQSINMSKTLQNGEVLKDKEATLAVNNAIRDLKLAFEDFVYERADHSSALQKTYNDIFNTDVLREYDGSGLKFQGKNELIELRKHQKDAVFRVLSSKNVLFDHTVGTGKTFTMIASGMELKRVGQANKPLFVVPKATIEQFSKDFALLYPNSNVLTATKFDAKNRQRTLASISTGDWDAVVITHENFGALRLKPEIERDYLFKEIIDLERSLTELKNAKDNPINIKNLEQILQNRREKLEALSTAMQKRKDEIYFDELGVDALFVDEAHAFKNLNYFTRMHNVRGLGNQKGSQRANDMFYKTRWLNENDNKIVFATGTPITNTIAELYTIQRYLGLNDLETKGIRTFDEWVKLYGKIENNFELDHVGRYVQKTRLASFDNLPELITSYRKFADVITNDDVKAELLRQGKQNYTPPLEKNNIVAKISPDQEQYTQTLLERYEKLANKSEPNNTDNHLVIMNDAKKMSLDMRLINPYAKDFEGSKVNLAVKNIKQIYDDTADVKGTQLVFCDLSTPKPKKDNSAEILSLKQRALAGDEAADAKLALMAENGELDVKFSVYDDIRAKLESMGVKKDEIVFIHDYENNKKRQDLFEAINAGKVRIALGSTQKLGIGVNVQERIVAGHNLDCPFTPDKLTQRGGRWERQGNRLLEEIQGFKVKVYNYATEKTLDAQSWQRIEQKSTFIEQMRKGNFVGRSAKDVSEDVVDAATMKALASGNPDVLKEVELSKLIEEKQADKKRFLKANAAATKKIGELERTIQSLPNAIKEQEQDIAKIAPKAKEGGPLIKVGDKNYSTKQREEAIKAIVDKVGSAGHGLITLGKYRGLTITLQKGYDGNIKISLDGLRPHNLADMKLGSINSGIFTRFDNVITRMTGELKELKELMPNAKKELAQLKSSVKEFKGEAELKKLIKEHDEVVARLKGDDANNGVILNSNALVLAPLLGFVPVDDSDDEFVFNGTSAGIAGILGLSALALKGKKFSQKDIKNLAIMANTNFKASVARVLEQKEKRGIYNVAFNDKKSTIIYKDLENIEQIIKFEQGFENPKTNKGFGALHIQKHLNKNADGWVTSQEYLNMGQMLRKATMQEVKNKRVYTYFDDNNVRFRIIVGKNKNNERVISFYSNRKAGLNYNSQNYDDNLPKKEILEQNSLKFNKDSEREI